MINTASIDLSAEKIKTILFDTSALAFIYFLPAVSHLLSFPLYLLEPMRIMLVLSVAHTSRKNAYIIALTLPVFSFLISSHPSILKSLLITGELLINVWLFFYFSDKFKNIFTSAVLSIIVSKILYYAFKMLFISAGMLNSELISTPILLQLSVTLVLSGYLFFILNKRE
jgi:hypothetical protein